MATQYKLHYFNFRGRAEVPRFLFHEAGVAYEDIRVGGQPKVDVSEWQAKKKEMPFGQLPVLEVIQDGKVTTIAQSHAIARYLARKFGLNGATPEEEAVVEMTADCIDDYIVGPVSRFHKENDPQRKEQLMDVYKNKELPEALTLFERHLIRNDGGDGWFVGSQMTWCDIAFAHWMVDAWPGKVMPSLSDYPKLEALVARTRSQPKIAEWIKIRPVTRM